MQGFGGKPEGKTTLRPKGRWKYNTKMELQIGRGLERIDLAKGTNRRWAVVKAIMNIRFRDCLRH
jgi:hypothetical protein